MYHAGDLRLAPALLDMQLADNVGPTLAAIGQVRWPATSVPPPDWPLVPGLCAAMVAEKPPPNEAV